MTTGRRSALIGLMVVAAGVAVWLVLRPDSLPEAVELRPAVHGRPPIPIVFTSRSEPASFEAAAPEGAGHHYPGQALWAAREGRLRLLTPKGTVHELTWGRKLRDGSTLIDVMSPSVSLDGKKIIFAGRKGPPDPGRFRLFEIGVDGTGLRQITGKADDSGCVEVPPLRFDPDGKVMSAEDRKRLDYDDVDPIYRGDLAVIFASSRTPDLGRGHTRRSTQIWQLFAGDNEPKPLSSNRNNDRWPYLLSNGIVSFSLWSRNVECITGDLRDIQPYRPDGDFATRPTNTWMAAHVYPWADQFGYYIKVPQPIWRPRPTFNGQLVFMAPMTDGTSDRLRVGQAPAGLLSHSPSALVPGEPLPAQKIEDLTWGPDRDAEGTALSVATPSPCPPDLVVVSAAPLRGEGQTPEPGKYGLYLVSDDWKPTRKPVPQLLFDDAALVDAEPVAVYSRPIRLSPEPPHKTSEQVVPPLLANGQTYRGSVGLVENTSLITYTSEGAPFQLTDRGEDPLFAPINTEVTHIAFYASHRDRFDDPERLRVEGKWELLLKTPMQPTGSVLKTWVPTHAPTVLAGLDKEGKIARWTSPAKDSKGRSATFYAYAGDHYSGLRPGGYHFCLGCHTGHTFIPDDLSERTR